MPGNLFAPNGAAIYVRHGDLLTLDVSPCQAVTGGVSVNVMVRMQQASDGQIVDLFFNSAGNSGNWNAVGPNYTQWPLPEGWIVAATVENQTSGGVPAFIQAGFAIFQLFVGPGNQAGQGTILFGPNTQICLIASCISSFQGMSWPSPNVKLATDSPPCVISATVSTPGAGANFTSTFGATLRQQIVNVRFQLVTSASAANRFVGITFTGPSAGPIFAESQCPIAQVASTTATYNFGVAIGASNSTPATGFTANQLCPLPMGLIVNDASVLASVVQNIQAADQISAICIRTLMWGEFI